MKRFLFLIILLLTACNNAPQTATDMAQVADTAVPATHTVVASPTNTATPFPTSTPTATPTITPTSTETATPTITPTPTNTPTPELPVGLGTAVPQPLHQLSPDNAAQIVELARYGDGELLDVQLSQDESTLYLIYSTGLYTFDVETGEMAKAVDVFIPYNPHKPFTIRYTIAPDGRYLALLKEPELEVWDIVDGVLRHTFTIEEIPYYFDDFTFSPDSQSLTIHTYTSMPPGSHLWLWDMADGELRIHQQGVYIRQALFWPDGKRLLICCAEFSADAQLWQIADGTLVDTLVGPPWPDGISDMTLSPDESVLAAVYKNSVWLWDTATGEIVQQLNRRNGQGRGGELAFLGEGNVLSMYTYDLESLRLWDVAEGTLIADLPEQHNPVLSPDQTRLFTNSSEQGFYQLTLWGLDGYQPTKLWYIGENYTLLNGTFVADGDFAFVGSDRFAQLLQSNDGSVVQTFEGERYGFALPDGDMFVTISNYGLVFREAENGHIRHTIEGFECLLFPNNEMIATWHGTVGSNLALWNTSDGTQLQITPLPLSGRYYIGHKQTRPAGEQIPEEYIPFLITVAYSGSQKYDSSDSSLSIRRNGTNIEVFDASTYSGEGVWNPDLLYTIPIPQLTGFSLSPDDQIIVALINDRELSFWQAEDGAPINSITVSAPILDFQFSPDSQQIYVTSSADYRELFGVWDIVTGNKLFGDVYSLEFQDGNTIWYCFRRPMAIAPTGDLVAYSSTDCQIQIRQTDNWQILQTIDPGFGLRGRMAFSLDGTLLATAFQGGEIKLWDTETGELVHTILDHDSPINDEPTVQFAFSDDGQLLGTGANGILRLWGIWP